LLLLVRAALPTLVARAIEREGSAALGVAVRVPNVDLALWRGMLRLDDVRIAAAPVDGRTPAEDLLHLAHVQARVSWPATLAGTPTLARLRLESPTLRLRRLADGSLDALQLGRGEPGSETSEAQKATPLAARIESFVIVGLDAELRDEGAGDARPLRLAIESLEFTGAQVAEGQIVLAAIELDEARIDLAPLAPAGLVIDGRAGDVSTAPDHAFAVEFRVALSEAKPPAMAALAGDLTLAPLAFAGRLETRDLPLAPLVEAAGTAPWNDWLRTGDLDTALSLRLSSDEAAGRVLSLNGRIAVDDLRVEDRAHDEAEEFALGWKQLELDLREARFEVDATGAVREPPHLRFAGITFHEPDLLVTRGSATLDAAAHGGDATSGDTGDTEGEGAEENARPAPTALSPQIRVDYLEIAKGHLSFVDRTTKPHFEEHFEEIELEATRIVPEKQTVSKLDLRLVRGDGVLEVQGGLGDGRSLEITLSDLDITPFNAYTLSRAGYVFERGKLSLASKVEQNAGELRAQTRMTFDDLAVEGTGRGVFERQFGMPLPMALALLRDPKGRITLDVPLQRHGKETELGLGRVALNALRTAIVGALASPLKIVGAVVAGHAAHASEALIEFHARHARPSSGANETLRPIVELLKRRPGLAVSLRGQVGPRDGPDERTDLDTLARERAERIRALLVETHEVKADQIVIDHQVSIGRPGVKWALVARPVMAAAAGDSPATTP